MEFQMSREIYQMQCHLLNNLRKEGKFCDVVIQTNQVDGGGNDRPMNITAHSCILSATSFIFYKNFTVNQTPENQNSFRIFSRGIKPEIWELVLEYIYLRKMTVASGLSKENLCSLFWLLKELHLINEVEYKKILHSSSKIFAFDILASTNDENYAVRFEEIVGGQKLRTKPHVAVTDVSISQDLNKQEGKQKVTSNEPDVPDDNDGLGIKGTEKSNEPYTAFDQEPQLRNVQPVTGDNDVPREESEHMILPVYEDNGSEGMRLSNVDSEKQSQEDQSSRNTEAVGGVFQDTPVSNNDLPNINVPPTGQESDDDDNVENDIPETDMDYENQGHAQDCQPTEYPQNDRAEMPQVRNEMTQERNTSSTISENLPEGNVMTSQAEDASVPAGESVRRMADWINQSSREEISNGAMEHGFGHESSNTVADHARHHVPVESNNQVTSDVQSTEQQALPMTDDSSTANKTENAFAVRTDAVEMPIGDSNIDTSAMINNSEQESPANAQLSGVEEQEDRGREKKSAEMKDSTDEIVDASSVLPENTEAFMLNDPEETPDSNDIFKSEWERLAGNFAFKSLCRISVLGKDDSGQSDSLPHLDSIKKEHDLGYENDNVKGQRQHSVTKGKKQRKKTKKASAGPWYSCSDCDQKFSTYVLFQKHQCNSNEFGKKGGSTHSDDLYANQTTEKPVRKSRKKRKTSNTDKWLPKPITIVPDNTRYSSDIENYSKNGEEDEEVALVSFGGKGGASDDTDIDETYLIPDHVSDEDSESDVKWTQVKKGKRKFKITRKKKDLTLLRKKTKKRGRPFGSKNKKVKALKVKLEVVDNNYSEEEGEDLTPKKRKGRPKGSKNRVKVKVEGEEGVEEIGSDGEVRVKPKKIRKRKRSLSEKMTPLRTPRSKVIVEEGDDLKGGMVEGTGENPAIMGRVARVFDVCNLCGEQVEQGGSKNLRIHRKTVCKVAMSPDFKDRPKNICPFCKKQLSRNSELNIHIKIHHLKGHPYKCRLCPEEFNTRDGVKQHMITVHDVERIKCSQCGKVFLDARNYNKHFRYCGPDGIIPVERTNKGCMCHICGHVSVNEGKNRVHLLYHKSPADWDFHCEVCNQAFAQKSDLKKHRMIHTGEKPYLCDLCPYATNRTSNLKLHMRKHTAERSEVTKNQDGALVYKCIECTSTFSLKTELKDHLKVHDTKQSRCFKKFRPRTKEDMQQKVKKPGMMRKHRPKYPPKVPEIKKDMPLDEGTAAMDEIVPTVVRDITMASLGPMGTVAAAAAAAADENLVGMGLPPSHSRAGMIPMNHHAVVTDTGHSSGMMGLGPGPIGTEARMMGYIGMAHYGQAGGERLIGMSGEMPVMDDRMMQMTRQSVGAVDERMHRIRNEESMLGYALRNNMPEAAYMNL